LAVGGPDNFPISLHLSGAELDVVSSLGDLDTNEPSARPGDNDQGRGITSCAGFEHHDERGFGARNRAPSSCLS